MAAPAERVGAVILAAGEAKRFGSQKLLAPLDGQPLLQHVIDAAQRAAIDPIVLVLGADADAIEDGVRIGRARVVLNPEYATGQASSLRAGLRALEGDAAIVLLGDQPLVTAPLLDALIARQRASGASAVVCAQRGRRSPPALLHRDLWPELDRLRGDVGAREVLAHRGDVEVVDVDEGSARLDDVDTSIDWERLHRR